MKKAIKVPKGAYYQSSLGRFVFVLSEDEKSAYKQEVRFGLQNPDFYEVVEGLNEGQKIIRSTYEGFKRKRKSDRNIKKISHARNKKFDQNI